MRETLLLAEVPEEELCMCIRNGITMSPVGSIREAVFRVPLLRWCTRPRGPEVWRKEAMDQHIVIFEFVRETSFFELFSIFELLCIAGWLTVL